MYSSHSIYALTCILDGCLRVASPTATLEVPVARTAGSAVCGCCADCSCPSTEPVPATIFRRRRDVCLDELAMTSEPRFTVNHTMFACIQPFRCACVCNRLTNECMQHLILVACVLVITPAHAFTVNNANVARALAPALPSQLREGYVRLRIVFQFFRLGVRYVHA